MDESSILKKLQEGDEQAWSDEYLRLREIAFAAAGFLGLSYEDIEEVASTALQQAADISPRIKSLEELDKVVSSISRRRAIDLIRKNGADKRPKTISGEQIGPDGEKTDLLDLIPDGMPLEITVPFTSEKQQRKKINTPELLSHLSDRPTEAELEKFRQLLNEVMDPLGEPGRSIWQEHYWQDLSYEELGKKHRKTPGAIRTLVCRTQAKLCKIIFESPKLVKRLREFLR